jgi:hypothetical protein
VWNVVRAEGAETDGGHCCTGAKPALRNGSGVDCIGRWECGVGGIGHLVLFYRSLQRTRIKPPGRDVKFATEWIGPIFFVRTSPILVRTAHGWPRGTQARSPLKT